LLDLGCGDGRLTAELAHRFPHLVEVLGIDVNEAAISAACARVACEDAGRISFKVGNATDLDLADRCFDVVLLQLVISIVGGLRCRCELLRRVLSLLAKDGRLLLSASGASDDINAEYAELYRKDEPLTGEAHTYLSRGPDGVVLYPTHHFEEEELRSLLVSEGFQILELRRECEASSRRPDQRAWFFYVVATRSACRKRELDAEAKCAANDRESAPQDPGAEPAPKRPRRAALAPGSDAYDAAVFAGLAAMQPLRDSEGCEERGAGESASEESTA